MINCKLVSEFTGFCVKVDKKSDLDKISSAFDCHTNTTDTDEVILDTTTISECEESTSLAIEVFGEDIWETLPIGLILFHG